MRLKVDEALLQGFDVFSLQFRLGHAAVVFQGPNRRDQDYALRFEAGVAALDVEEFLSAEVGSEAGFRNAVVP